MSKITIGVIEKAGTRTSTLEMRLLQFYVLIEMIWAFVNAVACLVLKMPAATTNVYAAFFVGLILYFTIAYKTKQIKVFINIYFVLYLIIIPVIWYFAGGSKSSASILFVCQLVVYVMCLSGNKQKTFIVISLLSSGLIQGVTRRLPNPVYPMTERQYGAGGAVLGLSTCVLIGALLIRQKLEYTAERDAALESEKQLEKSNALQKNFLANMSHEIRSPLGIVLGFNNLIKDSSDINQIHEYARDIEQSGTTLLTVINDILDYSKIESGKLDIIEDTYSFENLSINIVREIKLKCDEKGLKFTASIDEKIPDSLIGDNVRIRQCLLNLLSNAVKYTDHGEVKFVAECLELQDELCKLKFSVSDTGKGISNEAMPKLFSAFQRLDEGMNRGIEGTGLGLAITKNLLDEMDGRIEVESTLGEGATFVIYIDQKIGKKQEKEVIADDQKLDGIKVLVVDDTVLNLTLVKKLLEKEGALVTTIDNGFDCLTDVQNNKYDVILLDHMMPELNGVEVFDRMREAGGINNQTPVVMLTANAMAGASQEYIGMGFDGYLSKPISPTDLKKTIWKLASRQ